MWVCVSVWKYFSPILFFLGAIQLIFFSVHSSTCLVLPRRDLFLFALYYCPAPKLCSSFHFSPFEWMRNNFITYTRTSEAWDQPNLPTKCVYFCMYALYFNFRSSNAWTVHDSGQIQQEKRIIFCFVRFIRYLFFGCYSFFSLCVCVFERFFAHYFAWLCAMFCLN